MSKSLNILWSGTAIGAALLLAACHPSANGGADGNVLDLPALPATLPLEAGAATTPTYAPSADALPAAPRLRTVRVADPRDAYAYADDAWDFGNAIFDAPPDYGFDYAGTEPWAWQGYDQSLTFAEPLDDGYRYYYYRPGADEPYFIRDADYGYGYDGDQLAVIYGPGGAILPYDSYGPRIDYASRYLARARDLYAASRERDRRAVNAASWAARAAAISAAQSRWAAERARQSAWQDYHQRVAPVADRHWQEERVRRQADAQRFAAWRQSDYRTPPPPRVIPAAWQQAGWARDDRHYVALPARQPAETPRDAGAGQQRRAQDQALRQQAEQQRQAAVQAGAAQHQQQQAQAQQQLRTERDQQHAGDMARLQADRAARQAAAVQQRAAAPPLHDAQRQQAVASDAQRAQMQAQRAQVDAARQQARAAQAAAHDQARVRAQAPDQMRIEAQRARGQAEAQARAQAQAARARAQQARGQAEGQAPAQAQAARAQMQVQAQAAHAQEQAARAQMQAQAQAAHAQAQAARAQAQAARAQPQPQPPRPAPQPQQPQAAPQQHGGGGGDHGNHGRHPG